MLVWFSVLAAAFLIQVGAWAWVAAGLRRVREDAGHVALAGETSEGGLGDTEGVAISVVVAARNEADRLPTLLDALEAQSHRPFEVVVVDDRSSDGTAEVVRQRARLFPVPLRVVTVAEGEPEAAGLPPKKHALERGVEAATHDRVAFTDADGQPGLDWLATLARWAEAASPAALDPAEADRPSGAVLVGYGPYVAEPGLLNLFVRFETVQTAALAAAAVGWGRPWHAVGRNLSVPASLLERLGGYAHSARSLSGDDDLLVQHVAKTDVAPVAYVWDARAAVPSPAPPDAPAFWRQKRRHASAGTHYPLAVLIALGAFHTTNLALWILAPLTYVVTGHPIGWGLLAGKLLVQRTVVVSALDDLGGEADLRLWQPALDALSAVYHAALAVLGALPTPRRW